MLEHWRGGSGIEERVQRELKSAAERAVAAVPPHGPMCRCPGCDETRARTAAANRAVLPAAKAAANPAVPAGPPPKAFPAVPAAANPAVPAAPHTAVAADASVAAPKRRWNRSTIVARDVRLDQDPTIIAVRIRFDSEGNQITDVHGAADSAVPASSAADPAVHAAGQAVPAKTGVAPKIGQDTAHIEQSGETLNFATIDNLSSLRVWFLQYSILASVNG